YPIHEAILLLKKEGYTGIEIWYETFARQEKEATTSYAKIKKALIKTGLKGVVHAAIRDLAGNRLNICSKNDSLRKKSIKLNLESINLARQLGFHLVNIHPGSMDKEKDDPKEYWPLMFDAYKQFVAAAEQGNIVLAVETMEDRPLEFVKHAEDLKKLINHFKSDNLGATLDVVHSFTHGEEFPLKHMEELGVHLRHFHASGFWRKKNKTHCPFKMDPDHLVYFKKILKQVILDYDGIITIEGHLGGIMSETQENQLKAIRDNMDFIKKSVGGF
ncbi:sugar phosphate isomerase/epimerase, partial [Candidatus Woesearchaeota archaeon]|nr:sugar phosphate isomerase/epimerase [Candidatus Woesearchaeota archaeon]